MGVRCGVDGSIWGWGWGFERPCPSPARCSGLKPLLTPCAVRLARRFNKR